MTHFVSASTAGETCRCGKRAKHKLGEEIPFDEPCKSCGKLWRWSKPPPLTQITMCNDFYHSTVGRPRHNLTAYVCCACFTATLGEATKCPLTSNEKRAIELYTAAHAHRPGFTEPLPVLCPRCNGELVITSGNPEHTCLYADCKSCKICCVLPFEASV